MVKCRLETINDEMTTDGNTERPLSRPTSSDMTARENQLAQLSEQLRARSSLWRHAVSDGRLDRQHPPFQRFIPSITMRDEDGQPKAKKSKKTAGRKNTRFLNKNFP